MGGDPIYYRAESFRTIILVAVFQVSQDYACFVLSFVGFGARFVGLDRFRVVEDKLKIPSEIF